MCNVSVLPQGLFTWNHKNQANDVFSQENYDPFRVIQNRHIMTMSTTPKVKHFLDIFAYHVDTLNVIIVVFPRFIVRSLSSQKARKASTCNQCLFGESKMSTTLNWHGTI